MVLSHELWLGSCAALVLWSSRRSEQGLEGVVVLGLGCPEVSGLSLTRTDAMKNRWEMLR